LTLRLNCHTYYPGIYGLISTVLVPVPELYRAFGLMLLPIY
jgi:hypothetical protein